MSGARVRAEHVHVELGTEAWRKAAAEFERGNPGKSWDALPFFLQQEFACALANPGPAPLVVKLADPHATAHAEHRRMSAADFEGFEVGMVGDAMIVPELAMIQDMIDAKGGEPVAYTITALSSTVITLDESPPPPGSYAVTIDEAALGKALDDTRAAIWRLPCGIHLDVPADVYHHRELGGPVNCSALGEVAKSLSKYLAWCKGERSKADTKALYFGRALHCAVLEPYVFASTYAVRPEYPEPERPLGDDGKPLDFRKKENAAAKAEHMAAVTERLAVVAAWEAEHAEHIVLDREDAATIVKMSRAIQADEYASGLLSGGVAEATIRWNDEETGLPCKARLDYYVEAEGVIVDLKSTQDASDDGFGKSAAKWRYHVQAAHYMAGMRAIGKPASMFVFLAVEKEAPFDLALFYLDGDAAAKGEERYRREMRALAEALETGEFPGHPKGIRPLSLPHWST